MIQISKEEANMLRANFKDVPIKRTVHKYYTEERPQIMKLLGRTSPRKVWNGVSSQEA